MFNSQRFNKKISLNLNGSPKNRALLSVSAVSLLAETVLEMWDDFKRKYIAESYEGIEKKLKDTPSVDSNLTALKKAKAYNKFFSTVTESMANSKSVNIRHMSWLEQLSKKIDGAISASNEQKQNADALIDLKGRVLGVLQPALEKISNATFNQAMDLHVARDLPSITYTVNRVQAAIEINTICISVKPGEAGGTLYQQQQGHLREKWRVIKDAIEEGVLLGNETPISAQPELQHIIDSMSSTGAQLFPIKPTIALAIEHEASLPERLHDTTQYASRYEPTIHANRMLYDAWNRSFERGSASLDPEKIIGKIQEFHNALKARPSRYHDDIDAAPILLAEKLHARILEAEQLSGNNEETSLTLSQLKQATVDFIIEHAPVASMRAAIHLDLFQGISGNFGQITEGARMVRDAANITTIAFRFAPEFETSIATTFINRHYTKNLEKLEQSILSDSTTLKAVSLEMKIAGEALLAMNELEKKRDTLIAENKRNPTVSPARLQGAWDKTSLDSANTASAARILRTYDVFNETFSVYATQHPASTITIKLAGLMHDGLNHALKNLAPNSETATGIETLMTNTRTYLADMAPKVAAKAIADLGATASVNSYDDLLNAATRIQIAASAQTLAGKFAPNPEVDDPNEARINICFSKVQAALALGPSVVNSVTAPSTAMVAMDVASGQIETMLAARTPQLIIDNLAMNIQSA